MELKIPIEIVLDDVNSVIDELGKLQKYKLCEGDDMTLVDVDDVVDVLTRHVMAREAKKPCGTREGWIPCSERFPETDETVLVTCRNKKGGNNVNRAYCDKEGFWHGSGSMSNVVAWMPLPEPYRGKSE